MPLRTVKLRLAEYTGGLKGARRTVQDIATSGSWRVLALLCSVATSVWCARVLGPEKLGISAIVVGVTGGVSMLLGSCLEPFLIRSYVRNDYDREQGLLVAQVLTARLALAFVASILGAGFLFLRTNVFPAAAFASGSLLLAAQAFVSPWLLQARGQTPRLHRILAVQSLAMLLISMFLLNSESVATTDVVISGVTQFAFWWLALRSLCGNPARLLSLAALRGSLGLVRDGKLLVVTGLVVQLYAGSDVLYVAYFCGPEDAGKYRIASNLTTGLQALLAIVAAILYPKLIEWRKLSNEAFFLRQLQTFFLLSVTAAAVVVCAVPLLRPVVRLLFGEAYVDAWLWAAVLLCAKVLIMLHGVFSMGLWAGGRDLTLLKILLAVACFSVAANLWAVPRYGPIAAAAIAAASEGIVLILTGILAWRHSKVGLL